MTTDKQSLTASAYVPHLLAVLGEMTDYTAGITVIQERTFEPVCARMGISQDEFGKTDNGILWTHRRIGFAMRQMRDKQLTSYAAKGEWTLTETGAATAAQAVGRTPGDPVRDDSVAARAHTLALGEGESEEGQVLQLRPRVQHPYSDDPYIRSLAIKQTPCFGAFTSRSESCKLCRLSQECVAALDGRLAEIAAELDREEAALAAKLAQKASAQASKDLPIDELIATFDEDTAKKSTKKNQPSGEKFKATSDMHVVPLSTAIADSKCLKCKTLIPKGTANLFWVKEKGVLHAECFDDSDMKS
jgi:uncharacterized small protein (DUF1192 family)